MVAGFEVEINEGFLFEVDIPDEKIARMLDLDKPLSEQPRILAALSGVGKNENLKRVRDAEIRAKQRFDTLSPKGPDGNTDLLALMLDSNKALDEASDALEKATLARVAQEDEMALVISNAVRQAKAGDKGITGETLRGLLERTASPERVSARLSELGIPGNKFLDQGSRASGKGTRNLVLFDDKDITILKRNEKTFSPKVDTPQTFPPGQIRVKVNNKTVRMLQNPTLQERSNFKASIRREKGIDKVSTRQTLDADGNVWVWDAEDAIHRDVEPALGKIVGKPLSQNQPPPSFNQRVQSARKPK
jgi:hypothetical protein